MTTLEKPATPAAVVGVSHEYAERLLSRGSDYFSAARVNRVYGLDLKEPTSLPFSNEEMDMSKRLGMLTVLFADKNAKGEPLTGKTMYDQFGNELRECADGQELEGEEKFLYDIDWHQKEPFFTAETPAPGYGLVTRVPVPDSTGKDYLGQTGVIADFVRGQLYAGEELPETYAQAIEEYNSRQEELRALTKKNWQEGAKQSVALKLNQLLRPSAVEFMYLVPLLYQINGEYLLSGAWAWTKSLSLGGSIVCVGDGDSRGVGVGRGGPPDSESRLGVVLLCRPLTE